jgi:hypothetical protein
VIAVADEFDIEADVGVVPRVKMKALRSWATLLGLTTVSVSVMVTVFRLVVMVAVASPGT